MKTCCSCEHYSEIGPFQFCSGPHVEPSVVSGVARMPLPQARLFDYSGIKGVPCGREGTHWAPAKVKPVAESYPTGPFFWAACVLVGFGIGWLVGRMW